MGFMTKVTQNAEAKVILSEGKELATDFLKIVVAAYLAPTSVLPGEATKFFEKHIKVFKSLPDRIFFQKLDWFFDDLEHLRLTDADKEAMKKRIRQINKEEFSFQLMDTIHKAYGKKQIHFTANSLKYALTHEEENRWLEEFYRVIFVILNTDVYSLEFLVEQLNLTDTMSRQQYSYNEKVQGLLSSGLMAADVFESSLTAGPGEQKYLFTPMADTVYKYIKDRA